MKDETEPGELGWPRNGLGKRLGGARGRGRARGRQKNSPFDGLLKARSLDGLSANYVGKKSRNFFRTTN